MCRSGFKGQKNQALFRHLWTYSTKVQHAFFQGGTRLFHTFDTFLPPKSDKTLHLLPTYFSYFCRDVACCVSLFPQRYVGQNPLLWATMSYDELLWDKLLFAPQIYYTAIAHCPVMSTCVQIWPDKSSYFALQIYDSTQAQNSDKFR